jgi:hypothetical protein
MLPGQLATESREAGQRHPGDFEAQVSQRPIAIHGLEHLGATDRGVTMFRHQIRRGITAVESGDGPPGLHRTAGPITPTYCNDTVVRMLPAATATEDRQLMRETGRQLAETYLKDPPLMMGRYAGGRQQSSDQSRNWGKPPTGSDRLNSTHGPQCRPTSEVRSGSRAVKLSVSLYSPDWSG